jgi:hypothetical protein
MLQNMPVQRLKGGNHTTGLPRDRQIIRLGEFSTSTKRQENGKLDDELLL